MIHEKIRGGVMAINALAGQVSSEAWDTLKNARAELLDAADQAENLEKNLTIGQLNSMIAGAEVANG